MLNIQRLQALLDNNIQSDSSPSQVLGGLHFGGSDELEF